MSIIKKLKNNIRKYIAVACSLFLIPIFSISSFAYTSYDFFPATVDNEIYFNTSPVYSGTFNSSSNIYSYNNASLTTDRFYSRFNDEPWSIAVNTDIYDYYFISSVYAPCSDISNFTYFPTTLAVYSYDHSNKSKKLDISNINIYHLDTVNYKGFSVSCKVDFSNDSNIGFIAYSTGFNFGTIPANLNIEYQVLALPKSLSNGDINAAVVAAINNQTLQLGSQLGEIDSGIDKGNELIENGNSDTQSALTDFNEVFEDFNNELDTWEQFDDDIIGEFNAANDNYKTELNNFNLAGSLLDASTWLSTSMQTVYDNSSDYKMLWLVPLLFGIPILLFVIKKDKEEK